MGGGSWDTKKFANYTKSSRGITLDFSGGYDTSHISDQEFFKARTINDALNPYNVMRECRDSAEHPCTIPVILALDVTGSMGTAAKTCASKLNVIMTKIFEDKEVKDVEFMIVGIGDFKYDNCPLQASQFESDIRIAEQLDQLYFEGGGGGNGFESYSAAWYFGLHNTDLDCNKRGCKGIIITMGDETLNPYIPAIGRKTTFEKVLGKSIENDIETKELYEQARQKFDIYHINVEHCHDDFEAIKRSFAILGENYRSSTIDNLADNIIDIIKNAAKNRESNSEDFVVPVETEDEVKTPVGFTANVNDKGEITW